ncbi:MAG TPA: ABC transporter ATP-binding protein [Desulfomonilaceae bacterium]|nr:ABC transporter ATP-binding protein [Desulfomonilaceae bacterium]
MGHVIIKDLCKEFVERRSQARIANSDALSHKGETIQVLDHIDLEFKNGELVCILGPSGCGKTTLVRIIAGFDDSTSGTVFIDGEKVSGPSSDHIFVFQHNGLLPWMTVWDNVGLGLRHAGQPEEKEQLVQEYIDAVNLTGFEHHYPHELSGGMQRRAELARALVVNPEVLFMDEPFAGLDFLTRLKMREEVINMHQLFRKTVIFITHDIDEALVMADRVILFTDRPAQVKADHMLEFPHPRDFQCDMELENLRRDVYSALGVHYAL